MDFCKEMTVVIPFLNEGIEVEETIKSIKSHTQQYLLILF